ncbi:hypothetical protein H8B02_20865 [Bradyrhizobium sp. Pear77]|nr:hypothetical protein [Bradyrhizobium altum]
MREAIQAIVASLLYLPPYSPDFNPIEMALFQSRCCAPPPRARCQIFGEQSPPQSTASPDECRNYLAAAGYDAT